ncbi:MAG: hypothetical protein EON54_14730 [Alcaligenaceae bacterium]|nr:MAG: hypothetical protein EON54_14730 [Alcaligenaceae bacterium]
MDIIIQTEIKVKSDTDILFDHADKLLISSTIDQVNNFKAYVNDNPHSISAQYIFLEDIDSAYQSFLDFCALDIQNNHQPHAQFLAEDLFDWVPDVLAADVERLVLNQFKGDKAAYIQHVANYFATFTVEDLFIANLSESGHFSQLLTKTFMKLRKRKLWHAMVLLKLVGGYKDLKLPAYVCRSLLLEHKRRIKRAQDYVKKNYIVSEDGTVFALSEVCRTTENRQAESLNVVRTFERIAQPDPKKAKVFEWAFITLTLPPEKHPNPSVGRNSYDGTSPYESARGMKRSWNRVRALLRKRGIEPAADYYGALVSEAHKDGCQHLHALFFYRACDLAAIQECFKAVFPNLNFDQNDRNCSFKLDNGKAKASSYAFKYINKATSLFDPELDVFGKLDEPTANAIANSAFRSYNNIRGISYFGLENCLTKWRFVSRHKTKLQRGSRLATIVEEKDFYAFLEENHFSYIENEYREVEKTRLDAYGDSQTKLSKRFIGCRINDFLFLKNFFAKCATRTPAKKYKEALAEKAKASREEAEQNGSTGLTKTASKRSTVLVNHNYSSEDQKAGANAGPQKKTDRKWLGDRHVDRLHRELSMFGFHGTPLTYKYTLPDAL